MDTNSGCPPLPIRSDELSTGISDELNGYGADRQAPVATLSERAISDPLNIFDPAGNPRVGTSSHYSKLPSRRKLRMPLPVPVPNLIKKSRGRHVCMSLHDIDERVFVCQVEGCGKGFVRGEHLRRHVRGIHTNEKPHACPYKGCGKSYSRRDNLAQHSRVHLPRT
ncbi:hypothetical protein C8R43DRAFT_894358 [Mycena crocata]|nr:hypothetical protein C8R43DRAFT_894358 [Mycena crocata]